MHPLDYEIMMSIYERSLIIELFYNDLKKNYNR